MSLDVSLMVVREVEAYEANITHNLNRMADAAGLYEALWRPEEVGLMKAGQLIEPLERGLNRLIGDPEHFKQYNPASGWGSYDHLVRFVTKYLEACRAYPEATVRVSR